MTDRLSEIEARLDAVTPEPLMAEDGTCYSESAYDLIATATQDLRNLVEVAKAARGVTRPEPIDGVMYCGVCGTYVDRCSCPVATLRAALANLEGGAKT